MPFAKIIYLLMLIGTGRYYGSHLLYGAVAEERTMLENVSHYLGVVGNVYRQTFVYGWQEAFNSLGQNPWIIPTLGSILLVGAVTVVSDALFRRRVCSRHDGKCKLWLLGGLLFILPSIGVVMWLEKFQRDLWRMYIYVPIGAAAVVISFLLLIVVRSKDSVFAKPSSPVSACCLYCLQFLAFMCNIAFREQRKCQGIRYSLQIVEKAPSFDSKARLMLVTDMAFNDLDAAGIRELHLPICLTAQSLCFIKIVRPKVAFLCVLGERCSTDDIDVREKYLKNGTDYSDFVMFRLYDDLSVELLRELPPELNDGQNHTYDPEPLIDTSAPIPPRALTMLASARRN